MSELFDKKDKRQHRLDQDVKRGLSVKCKTKTCGLIVPKRTIIADGKCHGCMLAAQNELRDQDPGTPWEDPHARTMYRVTMDYCISTGQRIGWNNLAVLKNMGCRTGQVI